MAATSDLIDFGVIESQKENIQALPSGRSAKALAQLYSPPLLGAQPSPAAANDANLEAKAVFERELASIEEADDPLDVYDRYVKWTLNTYPSAQATPQSGLLPLLERATKTFQSSTHYKNDPRYLKLWLHYIQLFSDAPREAFVFLARHDIGEGLALYYEEFAAWLENAGRWNQAEEIYKLGIEREARPVERLMRKFGEFERRNQARPQDAAEPTSPALPAVRPALAAKLDPFSSASPSAASQQQSSSGGSKKSKGAKMAIFSDNDAPSRPSSNNSSKGWDSIGSLGERKKENSMEAKPWAGEKLKGGKTNGGMQKMMVFHDPYSKEASKPRHLSRINTKSAHAEQFVLNPRTGRMECVYVDLEAVYPEPGDLSIEFSFEELRAMRRGLVDKNGKTIVKTMPRPSQTVASNDSTPQKEPPVQVAQDSTTHLELPSRPKSKDTGFKIFEDAPVDAKPREDVRRNKQVVTETTTKTLALNDENDENSPPVRAEVDAAKKARREERANRTRKIKVMDVQHIKNETKTIQLNMDSPTGTKVKRKKISDRAEPTMTINTKEAMDEIYGIFSQPLPSESAQPEEAEDEDDSDEDDEDDEDDDYTTGDESTATGKLSAPASEYGDETRNELLGAQKSSGEDQDDNTGWSDFTTSRHVPKADEEAADSTQNTAQDQSEAQSLSEELATPVDEDGPRTRNISIPPEDFDHPAMEHARETAYIPNHRLPFMTPIVEQTETSIDAGTARTGKDYSGSKTPSRKTGMATPLGDDEEPCSSPFQDVTADLDEDKHRILQPVRTKSTRGIIALGHGSAKAQMDAKTHDLTGPEPANKGPIIQDEQCNPMDPLIRQTILSRMKPPLSSYEGYYEHLDVSFGRTSEIKKYIRTTAKSARGHVHSDKSASVTPAAPTLALPGSDTTYTIKRELGAGTFAPVYLVENSAVAAREQAGDEVESEHSALARVGKATHRRGLEAIKMEEPASTWEFYMLRQSHRRLGVSRAAESIVRAHEMHVFGDECYLVEEYREQGTLLDLVNLARVESGSVGGGMEESLAMWFTVELLRTVEALHGKQLVHGDLKADNVLVRFDDPGDETDWSTTYFPSGAHGWASKGVCLIDFGRGIDMRQHVPGVAFIADWKTSEADCAEMRELRPWTYQIDYHGLAGTVHSMLFGKYMETVGEKAGGGGSVGGSGGGLGGAAARTYRIRESLKRYWQTDLWAELFHLLLNPLAHVAPEEGRKMPVVKGMQACREKMEAWLEENCERGVGLKGAISRMEATMRERRRKSTKAGQ